MPSLRLSARFLALAVPLFLPLTPLPAWAVDYWVAPSGNDGYPGTMAAPFRTIGRAAGLARPGTTVHVAPGTYTQILKTYASGTASARIRYVSDQRWGAKIRTSGDSTHWSWWNYGNYVNIEGFDVSNNGAGGIFDDASNVSIIGNHVHDIPAAGCTGNGGAGIDSGRYTAVNGQIIGNLVHDIGNYASGCQRVHGIYFSHQTGLIQNNIVYRASGQGINLWHAANAVTISNNLVFNNRGNGIDIGAGDSPYNGSSSHPADYMKVNNNIVIDNGVYGIKESGVTGRNNVYRNNLVRTSGSRDWLLQNGLRATGSLSSNPSFARYDRNGGGDYHLAADSPAIDSGIADGAPKIDHEGTSRPQGSAIDIGPYERVSPGS